MPSPFPCSPVICECSWKKTQIEKKNGFNFLCSSENIKTLCYLPTTNFRTSVNWFIYNKPSLNVKKSKNISKPYETRKLKVINRVLKFLVLFFFTHFLWIVRICLVFLYFCCQLRFDKNLLRTIYWKLNVP